MLLTRSLLNDFRTLFRLMEDPSPPAFASPRYARPDTWQPFAKLRRQAVVEVSVEGNEFVVQAEMPGVKKENLDIRLGNDGQSLTIEGLVQRVTSASESQSGNANATENTTQVKPESNAVDTPAHSEFRSSFARTLRLPQPADVKKVSAHLLDGILTLRIPKKELLGPERIQIN